MKKFVMGAVAAATLAIASPSHAITTFATYLQDNSNEQAFSFIRNGTGGFLDAVVNVNLLLQGTLYTDVVLTFDGQIDNDPANPAEVNVFGLGQDGLYGNFSFISGTTNLLSASFANGAVLFGGTSGNVRAATLFGGIISYTSDVVAPGTFGAPRDFSFALTAATPTPTVTANGLNSFTASSSGNFSATQAVPEPATWAMMIIGFGAAGAMVRRRRALSVAA